MRTEALAEWSQDSSGTWQTRAPTTTACALWWSSHDDAEGEKMRDVLGKVPFCAVQPLLRGIPRGVDNVMLAGRDQHNLAQQNALECIRMHKILRNRPPASRLQAENGNSPESSRFETRNDFWENPALGIPMQGPCGRSGSSCRSLCPDIDMSHSTQR